MDEGVEDLGDVVKLLMLAGVLCDARDMVLHLLQNYLVLYSNIPDVNAETVISSCDVLVGNSRNIAMGALLYIGMAVLGTMSI